MERSMVNMLVKPLLVMLILGGLSGSRAINPIAFIPDDKVMHGAFAYAKTDWMETKLEWEWWQSAAGILAFGITKECVDVAFGGQFDWKDVRADMIGWASFRMVHFKIQF